MEPIAGGPRHQEPAVVGAEIERPIDRAAVSLAVGALTARKAVKRPSTPAGPPLRPVTGRVEAAGPPGLVIHRMPSCRARALPASVGSTARRCPIPVDPECNRRDAVRNRCTSGAWLDPARRCPPTAIAAENAPKSGTREAALGNRTPGEPRPYALVESGPVHYFRPGSRSRSPAV